MSAIRAARPKKQQTLTSDMIMKNYYAVYILQSIYSISLSDELCNIQCIRLAEYKTCKNKRLAKI